MIVKLVGGPKDGEMFEWPKSEAFYFDVEVRREGWTYVLKDQQTAVYVEPESKEG